MGALLPEGRGHEPFLLLLLLGFPLACLAVLNLVALLGVVAIGGTLRVIRNVASILGIAGRKVDDPWRDAVGDAHPLFGVECGAISGQRLPAGPQTLGAAEG